MPKEKTNAMRMLDRAGIPYEPVYYDLAGEEFSGSAVSRLTGVSPDQSLKTLCARGERRGILVFVIPVATELDLKLAAAAAGDKRVELTHVNELVALTGYVRGGVSPIGMKKPYPTYFDETAPLYDRIAVSAGQKGCTLLIAPGPLIAYLGAGVAALTR